MQTREHRNWKNMASSMIGNVLLVTGSIFAFSGVTGAVLCLTSLVRTDSMAERIRAVLLCLAMAVLSGGAAWLGWKLTKQKPKAPASVPVSPEKPETAVRKTPSVPAAPAAAKKQCALCGKPLFTPQPRSQGLCPSCQRQEADIQKARKEMDQIYQTFLETDGRLPQGFSAPYLRHTSGYVYPGTPFDSYVDKITQNADKVSNETGISDWLHWDASADINLAAAEIVSWVHRHRETQRCLQEMCRVGNTRIFPPLTQHCREGVMVILEDGDLFRGISEKSLEDCKAAGVSFCTLLSDRKLYDLTEQKEKGVSADSHPNYHDETYADWYLIDQTSFDWRFL